MPSTRARSLPRPPGTIPSGVSAPAIAPPTAPTRPSPPITTGTSPAPIARSARSIPCSMSRVRSHPESMRRASSACSTRGSSFSARPPDDGLTSNVSGMPSIPIELAAAASLRRRGARRGSCRRRSSGLDQPDPRRASWRRNRPPVEPAATSRPPRAARIRWAPGAARGRSRWSWAGVDLGDEVEEAVGVGEGGRLAGLERDASLGVEADPRGGLRGRAPADRSPRARAPGELAGEKQRRLAVAAADGERAFGERTCRAAVARA